MTTKILRAEIYEYIFKNILNKKLSIKEWKSHQNKIKTLLVKFRETLIQETPAPAKPVFVAKKISGEERRANDLKNGIWRADEFYR